MLFIEDVPENQTFGKACPTGVVGRIHAQCAGIAGQRVARTAKFAQDVAAIAKCVCIVGLERKRALIACQRLLKAIEVRQGIAFVVQRHCIVRLKCQCLAETGESLSRTPHPQQCVTEVRIRLRRRGVDRQRPGDKSERFCLPPLLAFKHPQIMQRVEIGWRLAQHFAIQSLRRGKLALLMQFERAGELLRNVRPAAVTHGTWGRNAGRLTRNTRGDTGVRLRKHAVAILVPFTAAAMTNLIAPDIQS